MRTDKIKLSEIGSWILVLCVLLTTILVVRREFLQSSTATATEQQAVQATYVDGWPDVLAGGIRSGSADAPVQVVEFADFQCPWCARFEAIARTIRAKYPEEVAFTFAHFPLPGHSFAESAARVAECAHNQGRFDAMRSVLFEKQQAFGSVPWTDFAEQAGISDVAQFDACVNDTRPLERIDQGKKLGLEIGVRGTPTIIVNGWKLPVTPSSEVFDEIVKNVLNGRTQAGLRT